MAMANWQRQVNSTNNRHHHTSRNDKDASCMLLLLLHQCALDEEASGWLY
jgi:hypothetical protein